MKPIAVAFLTLIFPMVLPAVEATDAEQLFALKVHPLLAQKCLACHGDEEDKIKGDFDMRTRMSMLKGGSTFAGEVLILGKGDESLLYRSTTRTVEDFEMPPKEADQLSEEEQQWIRDWIDADAPWPDDARLTLIQEAFAEGVRVPTSKALSDDWQNRRYEQSRLWAYQPLKVQEVPANAHPVDWLPP